MRASHVSGPVRPPYGPRHLRPATAVLWGTIGIVLAIAVLVVTHRA
ncbi:MAG TPA: hypothetical protein VOB72_06525 [Candidatus Dormibacteraeota bacterium]|nr:hypothetical protein [Candidatus Dormibacteraeota bacterium]